MYFLLGREIYLLKHSFLLVRYISRHVYYLYVTQCLFYSVNLL